MHYMETVYFSVFKTHAKSSFVPFSLDWIFRTIAKVKNSGSYSTLIVALVTVNGHQKVVWRKKCRFQPNLRLPLFIHHL